MSEFQAQAPICPFCFDDHSSLSDCKVKDLKKEIIKLELEIMRTKPKLSDSDYKNVEDMVDWL